MSLFLTKPKERGLNVIIIGERKNLKNRRTEILITNYEKQKGFSISRVFLAIATNVWLYVFGFATHILSFKAQKLINKTDIYNVLPAGAVN